MSSSETIWKFPFVVADEVTFPIPSTSTIIHVDRDCAWVRLDPTHAVVDGVTVLVRGTGHSFTGAEGDHIATWFMGPFVWHMFKKEPTP